MWEQKQVKMVYALKARMLQKISDVSARPTTMAQRMFGLVWRVMSSPAVQVHIDVEARGHDSVPEVLVAAV